MDSRVTYNWDAEKRRLNLEKHKLDFADAYLVYENPEKVTIRSLRRGENRDVDIAMVDVLGTVLTLVYVDRHPEIRIISFRPASRKERAIYAQVHEESN